jgi:hypothetical protein
MSSQSFPKQRRNSSGTSSAVGTCVSRGSKQPCLTDAPSAMRQKRGSKCVPLKGLFSFLFFSFCGFVIGMFRSLDSIWLILMWGGCSELFNFLFCPMVVFPSPPDELH